MLKLNLKLELCLAYAYLLGLFQSGYAHRIFAYKKRVQLPDFLPENKSRLLTSLEKFTE